MSERIDTINACDLNVYVVPRGCIDALDEERREWLSAPMVFEKMCMWKNVYERHFCKTLND